MKTRPLVVPWQVADQPPESREIFFYRRIRNVY